MNCKMYLPLLSAHIDGANSEIEERRLQDHLRSCKHCRALLSQMEQADALLSDARVEPPAELTAQIMAQIRAEPKKKRPRKRIWLSVGASALATAALFALVLLGNIPLFSDREELLPPSAEDHTETSADTTLLYNVQPEPTDPTVAADQSSASQNEETDIPSESSPVAFDVSQAPEPSESVPDTLVPSTGFGGTAEPTVENVPDEPPVAPDTPDLPPAAPDTPDLPPVASDTPDEPPAASDTPDLPPVAPDTPPVSQDVPTVSVAPSGSVGGASEPTETNPLGLFSNNNTPDQIYSYDGQTLQINAPALVIWNVSPSELEPLKDAEPISFPTEALAELFPPPSQTETEFRSPETLFSRLLSAMPLAKQFVSKRVLPPVPSALTVTAYTVLSDDMTALFDECLGTYELAAYGPASTTNLDNCLILVVQSEKASEEPTND